MAKSITWEYADYDTQVSDQALKERIFEESKTAPAGLVFLRLIKVIQSTSKRATPGAGLI
jgi:hypothetical protein